MKKDALLFISIIVPALMVLFYYKFYNEKNLLSIQCGLFQITGYLCPGCGGQRSLFHLLHGHILSAIKYNAILVFGLPVLIYMYYICIKVYILKKEKYLSSFVFSSRFGYSVLIILLVFFVIRNIPVKPFTYLTF